MKTDSEVLNREFLARMLPSQQAIRRFIFSVHPRAGDVDDIMQDTALSLWDKFETFDTTREFLPWAFRLACFEVLRFRKKCSRERLVFSNELIEILADEVSGEGFGENLKQALDGCLRRLDSRQREVVNARYVAGNSIAELAKTRNESPHRLYRDLEKSRTLLAICVRRKLADEGPALSL